METVLALVMFASLVGLALGLFFPRLVAFWRPEPSRGYVFLVYGAGLMVSVTLVALFVDLEPYEDDPAGAAAVSEACAGAFAEAAAVSNVQDTHADLFPAYGACRGIDEWRAADRMHPGAIDGVDPVAYARNMCAGNQDRLGGSAICRAVNEPPESEATVEGLSPSGESGLLGAPIPEGAELVESVPGDPEAMRDPREVYSINATAEEIGVFFRQEMSDEGWSLGGSSTADVIFFVRDDLMLGVIINEDEGRFTLMGS